MNAVQYVTGYVMAGGTLGLLGAGVVFTGFVVLRQAWLNASARKARRAAGLAAAIARHPVTLSKARTDRGAARGEVVLLVTIVVAFVVWAFAFLGMVTFVTVVAK